MPFVTPAGGAALAEHANDELVDVGVTAGSALTTYYDAIANGATIIQKSITTTKKTLIVVVTLSVIGISAQGTQIRRDGVDKTKETTISGVNFAVSAKYGHLQYATEVLEAGTYTYALVNIYGSSMNVYGSAMKIVAVEA